MATWQLQDAKAKFSEVIDQVEQTGPQIITKRGRQVAVIIPFATWQSEKDPDTRSALDILRSGPLFEIPIPERGRLKLREPIEL